MKLKSFSKKVLQTYVFSNLLFVCWQGTLLVVIGGFISMVQKMR